jgi:hypothetical protein
VATHSAILEDDMTRTASHILLGACLLTAVAVASAWAQQPAAQRVRGTIGQLEGNVLTVSSRDGGELKITLTGDVQVVAVVKASLEDIKPSSFIGSAAMPQPDGSQKALEVHIFPEAMRGTGEGHRPYTVPNSTMTNGTVGDAVTGVDGHTLTVKYAGGEKKIVVPPGVPIVRYEIGKKDELKPGAAITILAAVKQPDGTLQTARVNVGRDGVVPQ